MEIFSIRAVTQQMESAAVETPSTSNKDEVKETENNPEIAPVTFSLAKDSMEIDPPLINKEAYDAEKEKNRKRYIEFIVSVYLTIFGQV